MYKFNPHINVTSLFHRRTTKLNRRGDMYPTREWLLGLFVFTLLIVVGGLYNTHKFWLYKNIHTYEATFSEKVPTYDTSSVEQALQIFKNRSTAYEALKTPSVVVQQIPISEEVVSTSSVDAIRETATISSTTLDGSE